MKKENEKELLLEFLFNLVSQGFYKEEDVEPLLRYLPFRILDFETYRNLYYEH